jgi:hypothetical protein
MEHMPFGLREAGGDDIMGEILADTAEVHFLDAPRHPDAAALTAYWRGKCAGRPMPDRRDIVPPEIVRLLPNLHISEVVDGGRDFRFRLFGTALVNFLNVELTGKLLSELGQRTPVITDPSSAKRRWLDITARAHAGARPVFATGFFVNTVHRHVGWHAVSAPLTVGGSEIAQIIGGIFFTEER